MALEDPQLLFPCCETHALKALVFAAQRVFSLFLRRGEFSFLLISPAKADTRAVGGAAALGSLPDFMRSQMAQVPAPRQPSEGRHLELSLNSMF